MLRAVPGLLFHIVLSATIASAIRPACGQEFRVYTRVAQSAPGETTVDNRAPIARSTTLFHAGKAYDYLDSSGEITVFEPTHDRFLLVSPARRERTTLTFSELENRLHQASARAEKFLKEVSAGGHSDVADVAALVETQLRPNLRETLSADGKVLRLDSPVMSYQATLAPSPDSALVTAYARYVDWTARLNFVLHPRSNPPATRLLLNAALVRHSAFPMTVRLELHQKPSLVREATHQFEWKLTSTDRRQIQQWEQSLADPAFKTVAFDDFRRSK
jgi:hypothetical protein